MELLDGRLGLVEYKGPQCAELSEEQHKKTIGELWAERSGGKCFFGWVENKNWQALDATLAPVRA